MCACLCARRIAELRAKNDKYVEDFGHFDEVFKAELGLEIDKVAALEEKNTALTAELNKLKGQRIAAVVAAARISAHYQCFSVSESGSESDTESDSDIDIC